MPVEFVVENEIVATLSEILMMIFSQAAYLS